MSLPQMKTDWTENDYYNSEDLNRVGNAVAWLTERLTDYGYICVTNPKTNWTEKDEPVLYQMQQYLAEVAAVKTAFYSALPLPESVRFLTAEGANEIERMLIDTETLIQTMEKVFLRSNAAESNGLNLWIVN